MESLELGVVDEPYIKIKQKLANFKTCTHDKDCPWQ